MFVDAPNILQPADLVGFNLDSLGAGEANTENAEPDPSTIPRGWWRHNPEKNTYVGVLESISLLRDILAKDKYEVMYLQILVLCPFLKHILKLQGRIWIQSGSFYGSFDCGYSMY